ncbi:hypothetical protein ODJ79_20670 [Actinoplanes sp. KI2]|uniref:hypothetical protein n=1 Tax=Actinoplanes sp. KI2 TaxID=2983315 RepID=UPI0021D59FE9|nr:hypothetical protein [Actinoplanes sp. KI2]MCU7726147.1 hypothetical protein [Actinoplanes sp. KI2]
MTTATAEPGDPATGGFLFPGPWLGGLSLVVGPVLLLTGTLLRLGVPFFFPGQLTAYQQHPALMTTAYGMFLAGTIALWPGIVAVAVRVGISRPAWSAWGGSLVMLGLFARTFHYGVNTFAFALVDSAGVSAATRAVGSYYGYREWIASSLTLALMLGWIVLAIGCYLSRTLGLLPAIGLALMSGLMIGVLKGSTWPSAVEVAGLAAALVPLGVKTLRTARRPTRTAVTRTTLLLLLFVVGSVVLGQLG